MAKAFICLTTSEISLLYTFFKLDYVFFILHLKYLIILSTSGYLFENSHLSELNNKKSSPVFQDCFW